MHKHIIYDLDGTLFDTEYQTSEISAQLANAYGCRTDAKEVMRLAAGYGTREKFNLLARRYGVNLSEQDHKYLNREHEARKQKLYDGVIPVIDYVPEMLAAQRRAGHILSVGSSNPTERIRMGLDKTGLRYFFNDRVYGPDLTGGVRKPDPAVFLLAMKSNGSDASTTVIVEDTTPGIVAARAAGAYVVAYLDRAFGRGAAADKQAAKFKNAGADLIVSDYREMTHL